MSEGTVAFTVALSLCIAVFGVVAFSAALYGIFVAYPRHVARRVAERKASGRAGEASIVRLPRAEIRPSSSRRAVFTRVTIGLAIRVPGIEPYEVDKEFEIPSHALSRLAVGKVVPVWVDPDRPRDHDRIVITLE